MKTLPGLYLEEVEFVLENLPRYSQITVKKEMDKNDTFTIFSKMKTFIEKMKKCFIIRRRIIEAILWADQDSMPISMRKMKIVLIAYSDISFIQPASKPAYRL